VNPAGCPILFSIGATCWYFAQKLTDEMLAAGKTPIPIGISDTAIGGQRIEVHTDPCSEFLQQIPAVHP